MAKSCTYTFAGPDGKEITITGMAAFKAYLAGGGLRQFYPDGKVPGGAGDLDAMFDDALKAATGDKATGSLDDAINGLGALFGNKPNTASENTASYGDGVDMATYRQAKPLFEMALANVDNPDTRAAMFAVVKMVVDKFGAEAARNMKPYVTKFIAERGKQDVSNPDANLEQDRQKPAAQSAVGNPVQGNAGNAAGAAGQAGGQASREGRSGRPNDSGIQAGGAAAGGERGDQRVRGGRTESGFEDIAAGGQFSERGSDSGIVGVPPESIPASQVVAAATGPVQAAKSVSAQRSASTDVKPGDIDNIRDTLPALLPGQQEDVQKAEARFSKPDGYGMLFTNGTGTGKTFTGLGIVKRFALQGKTNTLIIVPDEKIGNDWIDSGRVLGLDITRLQDTKDAGKGIVITTYANLGENNELARRQWDLVVPDEAHTLMQSADGKETGYLKNLRAITYHPDGKYQRHAMLAADELAQLAEITERIEGVTKSLNNDDTMDSAMAGLSESLKKLNKQAEALQEKIAAIKEKVFAEVADMQGAKRTRAAFLSATPFAYVKTVDWANGYLFDYAPPGTEKADGAAYNSGNAREQFFMQHFGYRMRYNKLTEPDAKVDSGLMERQFNTWLRRNGVLSSRQLDVAADYDRRFVLVESAIGKQIDDALGWLSDKSSEKDGNPQAYRDLRDAIMSKFDYQSQRYLLEAIKASESVDIVRQHLAMGRKVVVFHDFKKGGGFNPFDIKPFAGEEAKKSGINDALSEFRSQFASLVNAPLGQLPSPIEVFSREFPDVMLINGDEKKRDLLARYKKFQSDDTGPSVMLVQSAKNKGWSGHDTTGKNQRVLLNLGLPTAPTLVIQQEGRIYRTGQVSNAIMRYLNTGTNWERRAFATTIASRASTAENLGMGEQARALKDSIIGAFEESDSFPPGHEGEGTGGKERDAALNNALSDYDRAKSLYWGQQKKTSKTKAQEGKDYFATPEPVGLKMVEWLGLRPGEDAMEPSAGHGAIARWLPEDVNRTAVEPSTVLRSRLMLAMNPDSDRILEGTFEDLHIGNKFDGIVMNPPFGVGGKLAIEHLDKAYKHLRPGGRIVALIPTGPAADKRFDDWYFGKDEKGRSLRDIQQIANILLPTGTFERAGTGVMTRIVVLEKPMEPGQQIPVSMRQVDLRDAGDTNALFERIENMSMPDRAKPVQAEPVAQAKPGRASRAEKPADADYTVDQEGREFITHVTAKGKTLRGIIVKGVSKDDALQLDPYSFKKGDGYFVREKHVRPDGNTAAEPVASYGNVNENTGAYETDLFGQPLPAATTRPVRARSSGARVRGDAQPATGLRDTPAPAGDYYARTLVGSEVNRKLGTDTVRNADDLAQATAYLYRSAVERFDGIVTDKAGKVLGVVGGFKGALAQTSVYPSTVMAEAIRIPGAANIWFSHNHPSGNPTLSHADEALWGNMENVFNGTGIEPMGVMAVAGEKYSFTGKNETKLSAAIPAAKGEFSTPVIERSIPLNAQKGDAVSTPSVAKDVVRTMLKQSGGRPGLVMLDSQHRVIGWLPVDGLLRGKLRDTGGMNALFRAASESNMAAVIMAHDGDLDAKLQGHVSVGQNIGAALQLVDVRVLDSIKRKGDAVVSAAETGDTLAAGPVYRSDRSQAAASGATSKGISAKEAQDAVNQTLAGLGLDGVVSVNVGRNPGVFGFTTAPGVVPSGGSHNGKIYVFTDNISDVTDVFNVVLHELFHMGLSQSVGQGEYIQTMLKFLADPAVRRYAERWKLSTDGQTRKGKMLVNNWNALAVEEAMADIAEDMGKDRIGTKQKSEFVRNMIRILANLAQKLKLSAVARKLRQMTYTESEKFVQDMMARARDGAPVLSNSDALSSSRERADQTQTEAFKRWFGDSKVVDADGKPLVVYHGTKGDFNEFKRGANKAFDPRGFYFSPFKSAAESYAARGTGVVKEVYLSISNPYVAKSYMDISKMSEERMAELKAQGYDGAYYQPDISKPFSYEYQEEWVAFDPAQIKSAIGNNGEFDPANPDIRFRSERPTDEAMDFTRDGRADAESLVSLAKAKDAKGLQREVTSRWGEFARMMHDGFADAMGPAKRWIEGLGASDRAKRELLSGLYRGAVQRDAIQQEAKDLHGTKILQGISKIAKANGLDAETAQKLVGYWLTANYAPKANDWLLTKDRRALDEARKGGDEVEIAEAEQKIKDRLAAINDPHVRNVTRKVGVAGGLNNAQAALMKSNIEKRIPADQIEAVAKEVYGLLKWKRDLDVKTGKVTAEQVAAWPKHPDYVPLTGSPFASLDVDVFGTGTNLPNTTKDKAIDGRTESVADDGISAVWREVSKSATHAGFQDFKAALNGVYEDVLGEYGSKAAAQEALGLSRQDGEYQASPGDDVVIYRNNGVTKVFRFEDKAVIDAIKKGNVEETNKLVQIAGMPTRLFSQLATLWNVTFAPMNMSRDVWEKSELVRTRDLVDKDGNKVDADKVARRMIGLAFTTGVWRAAARSAMGLPMEDTPAAKALKALQMNGGISTWGDHFAKRRGDLVDEVKDSTGKWAKVKHAVEAYNNTFEMVSSLASYMAMTEQGASAKEAAYQALDLMNFRKQGAIMGPLRSVYAFSQPIVTGGTNLIGALKTRKGQARFAAYVALGGVLYAMLRGMADDDEAGNKLDNVGQFVLDRSIPIPMGDGVLKIPVGFGLPQLAWSWAVNGVKMLAGEQTPGEALTEVAIRNTVKTLSPIQPTEISASKDTGAFLFTSAAPTVLRAFAQVAMNKTAFGAPIEPKFFKQDKFKSEQGRDQTAQFYKDVAEQIRELTGKDMFPEQVKVLVDGLAVGPLRTLLQVTVTNPNKERQGKDTDTPILSAFYQGWNDYAVRGKFYAALDEATTLQQRKNSGEKLEGAEDLKKLQWAEDWDKQAKELRNRKAAITRQKLPAEQDQARKAELAKEKEAAEARFLVRWRMIEGKTTTQAPAKTGAFSLESEK